MKSPYLLIASLLLVFSFSSCMEEKNPQHILAEVQNLNADNLSIAYIFGTDTLVKATGTTDTITALPFTGDVTIALNYEGKSFEFDKIPALYLNDLGRLSISRKVYQNDIFPTEWNELEERNFDYITLKLIVSPEKRFAIVLNYNSGKEIGRYFEKLN